MPNTMWSQSSDLEENRAQKYKGKEEEKHWYSLHPQVYYCNCIPSQVVDLLLDANAILLIVFGIAGYNDCPSILTLPAFLITFGIITVLLGVISAIFRVPKFGFRGKRDNSYFCVRALGLAGLLHCIAGVVWGGVIVFPKVGKQSGDETSDYYCKDHIFDLALGVVIFVIIILVILVIVIVYVCVKKANQKGDNESSDVTDHGDANSARSGATRITVINYQSTPQYGYPQATQNVQPAAVSRAGNTPVDHSQLSVAH